MLAKQILRKQKLVRNYSDIYSGLYVPGNQERMLNKCMTVKPSVIIPDMEDSVPLTKKADARKMIS